EQTGHWSICRSQSCSSLLLNTLAGERGVEAEMKSGCFYTDGNFRVVNVLAFPGFSFVGKKWGRPLGSDLFVVVKVQSCCTERDRPVSRRILLGFFLELIRDGLKLDQATAHIQPDARHSRNIMRRVKRIYFRNSIRNQITRTGSIPKIKRHRLSRANSVKTVG